MRRSKYWWYALVFVDNEIKKTKCYKTDKGLLRYISRTYKGKQYHAQIYIKPIEESSREVI